MSFYRSLFTVLTICVLASPAFAENPAPQSQVKQAAPAANAVAKINVNQVKTKELSGLKGMNPAMARSLIAYRKRHGDFKSLDDLVKVRALSTLNPADLKVIQDQLSL
jgi:competence ComEA-like helix-hairpin-helix protein